MTETVIFNMKNAVDGYLSNSIIEEVMNILKAKPVVEHVCHNCGGHLKLEETNHLFICPYCKTAYLIGTSQIYSK